MAQCYYCGTLLADVHARSCPTCGTKQSEGDRWERDVDWHPIAQFTYVAEAGYFADLLQSREIDARVEYRQRLSMPEGPWETLFELQVPRAQRYLALNILREALAGEELASEEPTSASSPSTDRAVSGYEFAAAGSSGMGLRSLSWKQDPWAKRHGPFDDATAFPTAKWLLIAVLVGTGGYWVGRLGQIPYSPTTAELGFWKAVVESAPWRAEPTSGQPRRALRFDPLRRLLVLEEDRDGDGHWDAVHGAVEVPRGIQ